MYPPARAPLSPVRGLVVSLFVLAWLSAPTCADCIWITEVVTDPEQDHSESSGGNGTPFDTTPGDGTVSSVDELVELFNAGPSPISLEGWKLEFVDSSPSAYEFGAGSAGVLRMSAGSSTDALAPGGYVLLGNPPGALNNAIDILLRDAEGGVVDSIGIDRGQSSGAGDEAIGRVWIDGVATGDLIRGPISPLGLLSGSGEPGCRSAGSVPMQPVPEPGTLVLVGASLLAIVRASSRRARRARRRNG